MAAPVLSNYTLKNKKGEVLATVRAFSAAEAIAAAGVHGEAVVSSTAVKFVTGGPSGHTYQYDTA